MSDSLWPHGLPGSSVHGILQAKTLELFAMPFCRGSSQPRAWTYVSCLLHWQAGSLLLAPPGKPLTSSGNPQLGVLLKGKREQGEWPASQALWGTTGRTHFSFMPPRVQTSWDAWRCKETRGWTGVASINHTVGTETVPSDLLCRPSQQLSPLKKEMASTAQLSLVFLIKGIRRGISKLYDSLHY